VDPAEASEVSAEARRRPGRTDWTFTFEVPPPVRLEQGRPRAEVEIAGAGVADARRFVHMPEEWLRAERARQSRSMVVTMSAGLLLALLALTLMVVAVVKLARGQLRRGAFGRVALAVALLFLALTSNEWPSAVAEFTTDRPYGDQLFAHIAGLGMAALFLAAVAGLLFALGERWSRAERPVPQGTALLGVGAGLLLAVLREVRPDARPDRLVWPDVSAAGATSPFLAEVLAPLAGLIMVVAVMLLLSGALHSLWRAGRVAPTIGTALVVALLFAALTPPDAAGTELVLRWLATGLAGAALLLALKELVERTHPVVLVPLFGAPAVLERFESVWQPGYPGAAGGAAAGAVLLAAAVWLVVQQVYRTRHHSPL
jgi:hypothetical protein